jgi:hypothetical protein
MVDIARHGVDAVKFGARMRCGKDRRCQPLATSRGGDNNSQASRYGTPDFGKMRPRFISVKQGQASATDMQKNNDTKYDSAFKKSTERIKNEDA